MSGVFSLFRETKISSTIKVEKHLQFQCLVFDKKIYILIKIYFQLFILIMIKMMIKTAQTFWLLYRTQYNKRS